MGTRCRVVALCVALMIATFLAPTPTIADPDPPAWTSFGAADFYGVDLAPGLSTDQLVYDLFLQSGAQIGLTVENVYSIYTINWISAFFVVSQDQLTDFTATYGSGPVDWVWEEKPLDSEPYPGRIAGFHDGLGRIYPEPDSPSSAHFVFGTLDITGNAVLPGYHIGYQDGATTTTGWFKGETSLVPLPEPSSLFGLGSAFVASLAILRRKLPR